MIVERNPPERKFLYMLKIFSQEDFALRSKLWPNNFSLHHPIFAGNSRFTGISQLRAGKTQSKQPRSNCMTYIFGKLWHSAINWPIRKSFQCILQSVRFLLANKTLLSGTSENESYPLVKRACWPKETEIWMTAPPGLYHNCQHRHRGAFGTEALARVLTTRAWAKIIWSSSYHHMIIIFSSSCTTIAKTGTSTPREKIILSPPLSSGNHLVSSMATLAQKL